MENKQILTYEQLEEELENTEIIDMETAIKCDFINQLRLILEGSNREETHYIELVEADDIDSVVFVLTEDLKSLRDEYIENLVNINEKEVEKQELVVKMIGIDNWDRPVYKDEKGNLYKDINLGKFKPSLCSVSSNEFYGEPEGKTMKNIEIKVVKDFKKNKEKER